MVNFNSIPGSAGILIIVLSIIVFLLVVIKLSQIFEKFLTKEKKSKNKQPEQQEKKEVVENKKSEDTTNEKQEHSENNAVVDNKPKVYSNYLYDRFVDNPTNADNVVDKKISEAFLSENEHHAIRDREIKIKVKETSQELNNELYKKIQAMANENHEVKNKLLNEFESLPREMKLLLIENIMQKM